METLLLRYEAVGKIAEQFDQNSIRAAVEIPENIGKMVVIDIETGDYIKSGSIGRIPDCRGLVSKPSDKLGVFTLF